MGSLAVLEFRMDAIMETLDLLGDPNGMKALRDYEGGKTKFLPLFTLSAMLAGRLSPGIVSRLR